MLLFKLGPLSNEIDRIYNEHYRNSPHQEVHDFYRAVKRRIRKAYQQDRIDVTLYVNCRDCKHMRRDNVGVFCKVWNGYNGCGENGFCSYGERRTDNDV